MTTLLLEAHLCFRVVLGCTCVNDSVNAWSSGERQLSISCLEADAFVLLGFWPCTAPLSNGINLLFLLAGQGLGGEATACAPPQAPVDSTVGQGASGGTSHSLQRGRAWAWCCSDFGQLHALCPRYRMAWCSALRHPQRPIVCAGGQSQTGQMPSGTEAGNDDRAARAAADGGLPSQQDAAEDGLLGLLQAPDGGIPRQLLVPGEDACFK